MFISTKCVIVLSNEWDTALIKDDNDRTADISENIMGSYTYIPLRRESTLHNIK